MNSDSNGFSSVYIICFIDFTLIVKKAAGSRQSSSLWSAVVRNLLHMKLLFMFRRYLFKKISTFCPRSSFFSLCQSVNYANTNSNNNYKDLLGKGTNYSLSLETGVYAIWYDNFLTPRKGDLRSMHMFGTCWFQIILVDWTMPVRLLEGSYLLISNFKSGIIYIDHCSI